MSEQYYRGFHLVMPTSGGKAGAGLNKTSNVQVRASGIILKQFRYIVGDRESLRTAKEKATQFIDSQHPKP